MPPSRHLPPHWNAEKIAGGFVVRDANGQALAYVYSRVTEADAMQAKALPMTRRAASRSTLRGCRSCWGTKNEGCAENAASLSGTEVPVGDGHYSPGGCACEARSPVRTAS
jgi:hypothetical protein